MRGTCMLLLGTLVALGCDDSTRENPYGWEDTVMFPSQDTNGSTQDLGPGVDTTGTPDTPVNPGDKPVGSACQDASECAGSAALCVDWPDGYCSVGACLGSSCPAGAVCGKMNLCLAACTAKSDCRPGYACLEGGCQPACSPGGCPPGEFCSADGICEAEEPCTCPPGQHCDWQGNCIPDECSCPPGQECDSQGNCVPETCTCPPGQECDPAGNCVDIPCTCPPGQVCNALGECVPESLGAVGDPCSEDADCEGGADALCFPETYSDGTPGWPNGYCVVLGCDTTDCPAGSECYTSGGYYFCLASCVEHSDCYSGYVCAQGACQPACSPGGCAEGYVCDPDGLCVPEDPCDCPDGYVCDAEGNCIPEGAGAVGDPCEMDSGCAGGELAACIPDTFSGGEPGWPNGYCTVLDCDQWDCPTGSSCFTTSDESLYFCLRDCLAASDCETGYACLDEACQPGCQPGDCGPGEVCGPDGVCVPEACTPGSCPAGTVCGPNGLCVPEEGGAVGDPCVDYQDCAGGDYAACIPETYGDGTPGWPNGYCTQTDCDVEDCPVGSDCYTDADNTYYVCLETCDTSADCSSLYVCTSGACFPACTPDSCEDGEVCGPDGLCVPEACTPGSCAPGFVCSADGVCVPDTSDFPGPGPGPSCPDVPSPDCTGSVSFCGQVVPFEPVLGSGWENYPLNGETWDNQYRSYARRDMLALVKWASELVACKSAGWPGNGPPLGLGDMSEADGSIPGTSIGQPGHPPGTHEDGYDMDLAYYQTGTPDNHLRAVCEHTINGVEQYHCVGEPYLADIWRTALFIGALIGHERTRVIGVDGQIGPLVEAAIDELCALGWLSGDSCNANAATLAYATSDDGSGWYLFHHHHLHLSLWGISNGLAISPATGSPCLTPDCSDPNVDVMVDGIARSREAPTIPGPRAPRWWDLD